MSVFTVFSSNHNTIPPVYQLEGTQGVLYGSQCPLVFNSTGFLTHFKTLIHDPFHIWAYVVILQKSQQY